MKIKVEYLAEIKEVELDTNNTIDILKNTIESVFCVPVNEQTLICNERNLNINNKTMEEMGIKENMVVHVKKLHKVGGKLKSNSMTSMLKNPIVKNMLKNPSTMKSIQDMFPGLKDEMEENSTLNSLFNNPGMEEELEAITRDDDSMNVYLRNADITMSKLQNLPEGMKLLNSISKDSMGLSNMQIPRAELKIGEPIEKKIEMTLPGKNRKNFLVEYRKQLSHLKQIGFEDTKENIEILKKFNGDLEMTVEVLSSKYTS